MLLPEYQINVIEKFRVLFSMCSICFSHSIWLESTLPSGRNGRYSTESLFRKPAKSSQNNKKDVPLFSFLAIMTLGCFHVFFPLWTNGIPLNKLLMSRTHVLKRTEVIAVRKTYQGSLLVILARFLRFLDGKFF